MSLALSPAMTHGGCSVNVGQRGEVMNAKTHVILLCLKGTRLWECRKLAFSVAVSGLWSSMGPLPWQVICKPWRDPMGDHGCPSLEPVVHVLTEKELTEGLLRMALSTDGFGDLSCKKLLKAPG